MNDPTADLLKGIPALAALVADARDRIVGLAVAGLRTHTALPTIGLRVRRVLDDLAPQAASVLSDVQLTAWLRAIRRTVNALPPSAVEKVVGRRIAPPRAEVRRINKLSKQLPALGDAARSLTSKRIITPDEIQLLSEAGKRESFWISGVDQDEIIVQVRDALSSAVSKGTTLRQFREEMNDILANTPLSDHHVETVFRTNVQQAYKEGRRKMEVNPVVARALPYKAYYAIHDGRVRPEHLALEHLGLNGTNIYRADDPMWQMFDPPWGFNCRCSATLISVRRAAEAGVLEARRWLDTGEPPENPEYRLFAIDFRPDPHWG